MFYSIYNYANNPKCHNPWLLCCPSRVNISLMVRENLKSSQISILVLGSFTLPRNRMRKQHLSVWLSADLSHFLGRFYFLFICYFFGQVPRVRKRINGSFFKQNLFCYISQ